MIHAHRNRITEAIGFANNIFKKISESEGIENAASVFDSSVFWSSFRLITQRIFVNITKLSFALSVEENISLANFSQMISSIENDLKDLSSVFFTFPKEQGLTLRSILRKWFKQIFSDFDEYFKFLQKKPVNSQAFKNDLKHVQAVILKSIEEIDNLPADNKLATIQVLEEEQALVDDAIQEFDESIECHHMMMEDYSENWKMIWNNKEFELAEKGEDVLKTVTALCKKLKLAVNTNGKCCTESQISQLDDLVDTFRKLSPAVDDFVSSLYTPQVMDEIKENVTGLRNLMNQLLNQAKVSHYTSETDMQWVNFLGQAVTHNCSKVDSAISSSVNNAEVHQLILDNLSLNNS
ncbi:cyclin-D1-binding protein 1 homolog [Nilaparvata lugens]|uniref:cyclin-D1-binding protein 1 homolog n=1 Tax=Nilaparvata lugens TaxID=108931 RepID=UPI00193EB427|nr:cyclin-D1-binding protein 1 homolog [Nilaparvata lugens]